MLPICLSEKLKLKTPTPDVQETKKFFFFPTNLHIGEKSSRQTNDRGEQAYGSNGIDSKMWTKMEKSSTNNNCSPCYDSWLLGIEFILLLICFEFSWSSFVRAYVDIWPKHMAQLKLPFVPDLVTREFCEEFFWKLDFE